jgi:hypothetical protein
MERHPGKLLNIKRVIILNVVLRLFLNLTMKEKYMHRTNFISSHIASIIGDIISAILNFAVATSTLSTVSVKTCIVIDCATAKTTSYP